ncbi:MAG: glycoside hydrolase family 28 protein [Edaphobacter sp.]|uniref:rhamnogalacturonidase n=1 Tax=Edaphobacter sp. TaxID=1934404 RepID=UPI00239902D9|nr:glycoside hydrolase family 28 protein [Edaphobacter sp.]MDE1177161.1 glycoside hydrolase family 28 protein [Edaphobacter sp.]
MSSSRREILRLSAFSAAAAGLTPASAYGAASAPLHGHPAETFDVRRFGATGNGTTIDSPAINRAIEAAASAGGGTIRFPAGTYASYSIRLKSNIALFLEPGATLLAASVPDQGTTTGGYDAAEPNPWEQYQDFGHSHWHNSLIWGEGLSNIAILGTGLIDGKGLSVGRKKEPPLAELPGVGNKAIALKNCHNVVLRDISILRGGHFGVLATGVDNLTIDNLKIDTMRDGIDVDCCHNVRITNCIVNSPWDDGICPKSSFALGYARTTENVTISNCYVTGNYKLGAMLDGSYQHFAPGEHGAPTGRIKLGTESAGGFRNITISNCVFDQCAGFALESVDGAIVENITFTGIAMNECANSVLLLRLGSRLRAPAGRPVGVLRRVLISDVVSTNCASRVASTISGIPGYNIEDIQLHNLYLHHIGGGTSETAALVPAEKENSYPSSGMFGALPAHGFFIRHARNLEFSNIEIASEHPDQRPAFWLNDVEDVDFFRIKTPRTGSPVVFDLRSVKDFQLGRSRDLVDLSLNTVDKRTIERVVKQPS